MFTREIEKGFKCTKCTKTFNSKRILGRHQRSVHKEKWKKVSSAQNVPRLSTVREFWEGIKKLFTRQNKKKVSSAQNVPRLSTVREF